MNELKRTNFTDKVQIKVDEISTIKVSYEEFVFGLIKKFDDWRLAHAHSGMGCTGEAGELSDAIKRHAIYGKPVDLANIVEELGDLEFYMQDVRTKYGITREDTLQGNAEKLEKRYVGLVYSDEAAIARADKTPQVAPVQAPVSIPTESVWPGVDWSSS